MAAKSTTLKELTKTPSGTGIGAVPNGGLQTSKTNGVGAGIDPGKVKSKDVWVKPAASLATIGVPNANPNNVGGPGVGGSPLPGANMSQILSGNQYWYGQGGRDAANPKPTGSGSGSNGGGGSAPAISAADLNPARIAQDRQVMSQADWLAKYGNINFDANAIRSIFDAATQAEYAAKRREYDATERKFYDQKGTEQLSILDARRRAAAQNAVQTGANKGMQNAMRLADIIDQTQATAPDALMLAEGRRALIDQEQAAITANAKEAEATSEQRKLDYAKLSSEMYATDAQKYVGELGYDATALEAAINKYNIDRGHGSGYQASGTPPSSQEKVLQDRAMYSKLLASAQASGDTATAQMAASMLGILSLTT